MNQSVTQPEDLTTEPAETWQPDVKRPLTPHDMSKAIQSIMFAVRHEAVTLHASQEPDHKTKMYSMQDIQMAIDVFEKMIIDGNAFKLKVYEIGEPVCPSFSENPFAEDSLYSMLKRTSNHARTTENLLITFMAFLATLVHGEPRVKKHPKTRSKNMQKHLDKFKMFFEVEDFPDVWFWPFIDMGLHARDIMKQNGINLERKTNHD
ncbi:MAG: hypothetical protein AB7S77_18630 [Desulfatirhabdiaceae bacterium]